jgi:hypothetical protein
MTTGPAEGTSSGPNSCTRCWPIPPSFIDWTFSTASSTSCLGSRSRRPSAGAREAVAPVKCVDTFLTGSLRHLTRRGTGDRLGTTRCARSHTELRHCGPKANGHHALDVRGRVTPRPRGQGVTRFKSCRPDTSRRPLNAQRPLAFAVRGRGCGSSAVAATGAARSPVGWSTADGPDPLNSPSSVR